MEKAVLSDPNIYPSDAILFSHLGKAKPAFVALFEFNHSAHPDFEEKWRYYNDGKRWLLNVSRIKKTLFWLSVWDNFFRTTFYLNPKSERSVIESGIPKELKNQYLKASAKKIRGITLVIKSMKELKVYKELLSIKLLNA